MVVDAVFRPSPEIPGTIPSVNQNYVDSSPRRWELGG